MPPSTSTIPSIKSTTNIFHLTAQWCKAMRRHVVQAFWKTVDYVCYWITSVHLTIVDAIYGSEPPSAVD